MLCTIGRMYTVLLSYGEGLIWRLFNADKHV